MIKSISAVDTAKIIRTVLKEAFLGIKFSVKVSNGYAVNIRWVDGVNSKQVEDVVNRFKGSFFNDKSDCYTFLDATFKGEPVRFNADYIFCIRSYSDAMIERAINATVRRFGGSKPIDSLPKISIQEYKKANFKLEDLMCLRFYEGDDFLLVREIDKNLFKNSDRLGGIYSPTAAQVVQHRKDSNS